MKIAVTADNHLTTLKRHPERFESFADILRKCLSLDIDILIIAGDLFDKERQNYSDFESICKKCNTQELRTLIIPGNHDQGFTSSMVALENIEIYTEPEIVTIEENWKLLLIPFKNDKSMGQEIAQFENSLKDINWLLIGHGDWTESLRSQHAYEPGVYMPLTLSDINQFNPSKIFLGHIHKPFDSSRLHYPGSPYPLDITETGIRRFLVFDTQSWEVASHSIDSAKIYFNEKFVVLPTETAIEELKSEIETRIEKWNLPTGWDEKVTVRIQVSGFTTDISAIKKTINKSFENFSFYDGEPISTELNHSNDPSRDHIAQQTRKWIDQLEWESNPDEPDKDKILEEALKLIYGV